MLSPDYFDFAADGILEIYTKLDESIIRDIARRLVKTGEVTDMAKWQIARLQESGLLYEDVISEIGKITEASDNSLRALFEDAGVESMTFDNAIYQAAGLSPVPLRQSPSMLAALQAGLQKTGGIMSNLTMTTATTTQTAYLNACDLAYMQVQSGAFDYVTAIKNAVKTTAQAGSEILYPSGHRDKIDVAIRRSVLTGVTQACGELQEMHADDMDCDLVETTAHAGARPEHALWQGKVFSRSGKSIKYPDFVKSTGYGTGPGLCGWNCRHSFFPFFEGASVPAYSQADRDRMKDPKVYEATQTQRAYERGIRRTKRELAAYDSALQAAPDDKTKQEFQAEFNRAAVKLKQQRTAYEKFSYEHHLMTQHERVQVLGYGRSTSSKAVWVEKRVANEANKLYNLGSNQENIKAYLHDKPIRDKILSDEQPKNRDLGKQGKHIIGHNNYIPGKSYLTISEQETQELVNKYAGTGQIERDRNGKWRNQEVIHGDKVIGYAVDKITGEAVPTADFKIHYGKNGVHIVPKRRDDQ